MQDVRGHAAALGASPFAQHFHRSPLGKALARSPEMRKLEAVDKLIAKQVGIGWAALRDDVLGEAVVFAYRPGPPGRPQQEQGLVLVRALLAERGASEAELEEHGAEIDRVRAELASLVQKGGGTRSVATAA